MIVGLERPTAGTIVACGRDRSRPARAAAERKMRGREVQIVFQDPYSSLDPRQTGADARRRGAARPPRWRRGHPPASRGRAGGARGARRASDERDAQGALGRSAPAGRHRPCPGHRPAGAHPRRVRRGAGRVDPGAGAQRPRGHPRPAGHQLRPHQPRPRRGAPAHRGGGRDATRHRRGAGRTSDILDNPQHAYTRCCGRVSPAGWHPQRRISALHVGGRGTAPVPVQEAVPG